MTQIIKKNAHIIVGALISVLLAINGYFLKEFIDTSLNNDKELLSRINNVEKTSLLNTQLLRFSTDDNKEEHQEIKDIIGGYHPLRFSFNWPTGDEKEEDYTPKLAAILNKEIKLNTFK